MEDKYSFKDFFTKEIAVSPGVNAAISQVIIPKIQRPYVHGRTDDKTEYIRNSFLDDIFQSLMHGTELDLNFVYGIVRKDNSNHEFELLDGQQRMTTLFLLYWYLCNQELKDDVCKSDEIRSMLGRFSYETRATSTSFCRMLSNYKVEIDPSQKPSKVLRSARWFFKSFDRDSTIEGMLVVLDAIHSKYCKLEVSGLFDNLQNINFYLKSLGYFNLSEELYIKMNARGLQLSSFENFKADLVDYISGDNYSELVYLPESNEKVPFNDNFSTKLDAYWIDIFWKRGSEGFDLSYMSFFYRYFVCKYIIETRETVNDKEMRTDDFVKKMFSEAESNWKKQEYLGFELFSSLLDKNPDYIRQLDKVLDTFYKYHSEYIAPALVAPWDEKRESFYNNIDVRFTQIRLIVFATIIEFIEAYDDFDPENFNRWMRVVWNVVENTNIDGLAPTTLLIRFFSNLIQSISKHEEPFYKALSLMKDDSRAPREEILKAGFIASDETWECEFKKYESHPYFKGMLGFYMTPEMSKSEFVRRSELISGMFDKSGISPQYRKNHILIRAIVSRMPYWERGLQERYLTENAEPQKYLKNILASNKYVRDMFREVLAKENHDEIENSLENDYIGQIDSLDVESHMKHAFERLVKDVSIYDWVAATEVEQSKRNNKNCRVYWYSGHIMLAVPKMSYARMVIDTDRHLMVDMLVNRDGFKFYDVNQKLAFSKYGDCFGNDIFLSKQIGKFVMYIIFSVRNQVYFSVESKFKKTAKILLSEFYQSVLHEEDDRIVCLQNMKYDKIDSFKFIEKRIEEVESILEGF